MIPSRNIFRSRWAALAWATGICLTAANFAGDRKVETVDAGNAADGKVAAASALLAEDPD